MRGFTLKQSHSSRLQPSDCRLRIEYKETALCHSHALASRDLFIIGSSSYSSAADPSTGHSPLSNPQCPLIPIASSSCTNRVTASRKEARIAGELTSYLPHLDHRETAKFSYTSSPYYQPLRQQLLSSYCHINRLSSSLLHSFATRIYYRRALSDGGVIIVTRNATTTLKPHILLLRHRRQQ